MLDAGCRLGGADGAEPANLAIWRIVERGCNRQNSVEGAPQAAVAGGLQCETDRGYAILKDRCGPTHFLLIPTARRAGVESPELLQPGEPNYFALAWNERGRSLATAPDSDAPEVGLAINSSYGRSQAQLHIHIDRLRPQVRAALLAAAGAPAAPGMAPGTRIEAMGHWYRVDHVDSLAQSPFVLLARDWGARTQDDRSRLTLAIVGDGATGFFLLSDRADLLTLDRGHAEELLVPRHCN